MDVTELNDTQKKALFDLLVLGMYADGNLDLIEDEKAKRVLETVSFPSDTEKKFFIDGSFARARKHGASPEGARRYIAAIAKHFSTLEMRRQVYGLLEDSLSSDNKIADSENKLLVVVMEEFKL